PPPVQHLVHKSLAASHVAASYWIAASDVAATSAPVNAAGHRSTAADHDGDRRSTDHRSTVVGGLVNAWTWAGLDRVWIRSRSGLGRVWVGSGSGLPYGMPRVCHVCPRGIHMDADVDNMQRVGIDPDKMADVTAPSGQAPTMAPPVRTDDQILPRIRCQLDEHWFVLTTDTLREALQITPINSNQAFIPSPTADTLINFVNELGYPKLVRNVSNEEFTQSIYTFIEDKRNLSRHTTGKNKATLIVIPSIRFTKLIIHHLQRRHKFHPKPDSPLHLPNEEPVLRYLKFSTKGTKREVFGMPIPGSLITADIQEASYYQEYMAKVAKHRSYLAGETGSDQDSPAPKPTKPARKPKSTVPKVPPRPSVSIPVTSAQPAPISAPAKPQEKKRKQATEASDKPPKAKKYKYSRVGKIRSLKSVAASKAEDVLAMEPQGSAPSVVIREPESGKYQPIPEVPRKGKAKVTEEKVAHDLLSLQKPKRKIHMDQYILQRRVSKPTGSSDHDDSPYAVLGQSDSEVESEMVVLEADEGCQSKAGSNPDEISEGQAGPDPGNVEVDVHSIPSHMVYAGSDREHMDLDVADVSPQPSTEQLDEGFSAAAYPKVQENLKLTVEEQVLLEEPANADKNAETKVESMVNVPIQHDLSLISLMTSPIIDLTSRPESPKVHQQFKATTTDTTTTTTTTTTLPPPQAQQQSTTEAMMIKRIDELKHIMANLNQVNKEMEERLDKHGARMYTLEQLDIPQQVSKAVSEVVTDAVDWAAMQAPLQNRFKDLPKADIKEILHQRMWETESYKSHEDHMQLFEALEKSMNCDHSEELVQDLAEAWKKKKKRASRSSQQPPPPPPPSSTNQESPSKGSAAPCSSKTAVSAEYQAWTTIDTGDMATFIDWFCKRRECHKLLTDSVNDPILRNNVSKPLPLGGPPGQVIIQSDFLFNKDLEYLRYGNKGSRPALSISKMKAAYYPDAGLEQMVPDQFWIDEECKTILLQYMASFTGGSKDNDSTLIYTRLKMMMRFNEIYKFSDGTLQQIDEEGRRLVQGIHVHYTKAFEDKKDVPQLGELYSVMDPVTHKFNTPSHSRWQSAPASDHLNQNALLSLKPRDHPKTISLGQYSIMLASSYTVKIKTDIKSPTHYPCDMCDEFTKIMDDEFEMSMMGELNFFLGLQIKQMEDGIFFNQSKYIKEMLKKFGLEDSKPMKDEECESTRKDCGTKRGRHSTSSSSAFDHPSSSYLNDDDDDDGNEERASRASTPFLTRFVNSLTNDVPQVFQNLPNIDPNMEPFYTRQTKIINRQGSGTPTEPYHTPSPEAQHTSYTTHSSPTLPPVTTAPIPTVTLSDTPTLRRYTRRARIAQSLTLPPVADEPASPLRDFNEGEACPTDSGFGVDQDRANIAKTSTLPHDSTPRVTSRTADEGSMQLKLDELTSLCTCLQRQHSKMVAKFEAQELKINRLKARVKLLEDRERMAAERSGDDASIKGRNLDEGEAAAERVSDDTKEMATVLTSMYVATVLASRVADIPTGSGSIPTAGSPAAEVPTGNDVVPTASLIFSSATVVTPYTRRKGKETMVESETPKKKKIQEHIYIQMARQLEEEMERDAQRMNKQIARDAEIARIHAEEELRIMIDRLDRSNETIAKYLQEYHQFATELPLERGIELISDLIKYQDNYDKHMDRKDLNQLSALVKESLSIRQHTSDKKMELLVELKRLYEPDDEDQLWTHTQNLMHAPVEWKLYDMCGVHQVTSKDKEIFMLVEKDYPLRKCLAIVMICYKLQVENYSQMASDLILKIHKIASSPRHQVIEFPLPKEVPTASEESCHCQKKREATAVKIALVLKSRRNYHSKSDDSYTKLVPYVTPYNLGITVIVTSCTRTPCPIKEVL
nr:copia protein [Tanacetum cinerariifolium]